MKKFLFCSVMTLLTVALFAQPPHREGPPPPPPIAERWKHDSTRLQLYVNLTPAQLANAKTVFTSFYQEMDALREKSKGVPPQKEEMDKIVNKRQAALKNILTAQQMSRFETFRKEFMPPPPPKRPNQKQGNPSEKV